ncbi:MAG: zinc ribbon domain-containing protein [Chloroflexi bacterium]|nr:zinc ribbon domain-containing protein [Chloroflexota bacterium]
MDSSVHMHDDLPRCPRCGKRNPPNVSECSACGFEFIPHRARIRCGHCGKRVPADEALCPNCGRDPQSSRVPFTLRVSAIFFIAILIGCGGWIAVRALIANGASAPSVDATPTQLIQVLVVVATPPPTAFPIITAISNATPTPTSRFSPTPTRVGTRANNSPTPSRTSTPPFYPAPKLLAPLNATIYAGADALIALEWQSVSASGLRENEWYMIAFTFTARDGKTATRNGWSKETRWQVNKEWYADISTSARTINWNVTVMRVEGPDPLSSPRAPGSPASATQTFFWK